MAGIIISVANNKGGTGKTTTAVNLSVALARQGKKVLTIDMDSQCNATQMLLSPDHQQDSSLLDVLDLSDPMPVSGCIAGTKFANLFCLPNVHETAGIEPELISNAPKSFYQFRERVREYATHEYDFTLIDCPPNVGTFIILSLYASDSVIVPSDAGSTNSFAGVIKAVEFIEKIRNAQGPDGVRFLKVLLTRADRRLSITNAIISQVQSAFPDDKRFKTLIPMNTAFQLAEAQNESIFRYDSKSKGCAAYRDLAKELITLFENGGSSR